MRNFKNILRIKPRLRFLKRIDIILCVEISVNTIQFSFVFLSVWSNPCWLTRSLLQWLHLVVLDIVKTKSGTFVSIMLYLVSAFDVTFRLHWLQRKVMEHMHNVTQYRSKYQTLIIPNKFWNGNVRSYNLRIIQDCFQSKIDRKIRIFSLGRKNNIKTRVYADFDFHHLNFHLQSECLCKTFPMKIMKITWFSCEWLYRWHHIFIPIVSHKDSFCHRGKSKLGIRLFIHEVFG